MVKANNSRVWGPYLWRFLHAMAFQYPEFPTEREIHQSMNFFQSLDQCLVASRMSSWNLFRDISDTAFRNSEALFSAVIEKHHEANRILHKSVYKKSFIQIAKANSYSFRPRHWGPALWHFLHTMAAKIDLTPETRRSVLVFLESLQYVIPCETCRRHYIENMSVLTADDLTDNMTLSLFIYQLHNTVNQQTKKKIYKKPFLGVFQFYAF